MKKKIAAVVAAVLVLSMNVPASAHYLIAERGTINNPEVSVERTRQEIIDIAKADNILVGVTENNLDLDGPVTVQDFTVMLWDFYRYPTAHGTIAINAYKADRYAIAAVKWAAGKNIIPQNAEPKAELTADDIYAFLSAAGLDISVVSKIPENPTRFDAVKAIVEALYNEPVNDYDRTGIMDTEESHHHNDPVDPEPPVPPFEGN